MLVARSWQLAFFSSRIPNILSCFSSRVPYIHSSQLAARIFQLACFHSSELAARIFQLACSQYPVSITKYSLHPQLAACSSHFLARVFLTSTARSLQLAFFSSRVSTARSLQLAFFSSRVPNILFQSRNVPYIHSSQLAARIFQLACSQHPVSITKCSFFDCYFDSLIRLRV